ncbi:hypothetical protein KEJ33_05455 [Candidatus Bathyarchaeota archaeon]|nr:hypothetical protein [Candidatus Bathyarchaeota archaeon]
MSFVCADVISKENADESSVKDGSSLQPPADFADRGRITLCFFMAEKEIVPVKKVPFNNC